MPKTTSRKRAALSLETKKALCQYKLEHPHDSAKRLIEIFNLEVDRSTVTKILAESDRWIAKDVSGNSGKLTKDRKEMFPKVNDALGEWMFGALATNRILTGKILQMKALEFAQRFPEEKDFKASDGWLQKFKKRHNLHHVKMHGEANSAPLDILPEERERLREVIGEYDLDDVYNADETALFFRMPPNATLATRPTSGTKRDKSRITLLLACNATGSVKLQPLVIGTAAKPRCFRNINMNTLPITYRYNKKAWMRGDIFGEWLNSLNAEMCRKKRKILLLLDNAGPHGREPSTLSNITVRYLPPNTTSHLQPLDAGIIASFKAQYRKLLLFHLIDQYDGKTPESTVTLKDAVDFLIDAWSAVTATTIQNCWRHTGILDDGQTPVQPLGVEQELLQEVQVLIEHFDIERFGINKPLAMDFINIDKSEPLFGYSSEDEIVDLINNKYNRDTNADDDSEIEDESPPVLSTLQGKAALEGALRYCEEQHSNTVGPDFLRTLRALIRDAVLKVQEEKKQLQIDSFFE